MKPTRSSPSQVIDPPPKAPTHFHSFHISKSSYNNSNTYTETQHPISFIIYIYIYIYMYSFVTHKSLFQLQP